MPQDVTLGAGYTGSALLGAFPGQYRDTEPVAETAPVPLAQLPSGQPRYVVAPPGPDNGRPMMLQNIPGIGQVVLPVEHTMAGAVVPVSHDMAGMNAVMPVDHTMAHHVREDLSGFEGLSDLGKLKRGASKLGQVAARAAHEALQNLRNRSYTSWEQVEQYVRSQVAAAKAKIEARLRKRLDRLPAVADQAVKHALAAAQPKAAAILRRGSGTAGVGQPEPGWAVDFGDIVQTEAPSRGMLTKELLREQVGAGFSNWRGSGFAGQGAQGDWYASMMGMHGIKESVLNLVAGKEMDQLARAMGKLQDGVIDAYNRLDALRKEEAEANARIAGKPLWVYGPFGVPLPTPVAVANLKVLASIDESYKSLTGFDYMADTLINVFTATRARLVSVYPATDSLIAILRRWTETWGRQITGKTKYLQLWDRIQNEHNRLFAAAAPGTLSGSWEHPQYIVTAQQAVENVLGIRSQAPAELGMGDFGITALIGLIAICVTVLALAVAAVALAKQFNAVANNVHAQRLAFEERMETQRKEFMDKCAAEGKGVEECTATWTASRKEQDAEQQKKESTYVQETPSALDIGKYIPWAAGVFAAVTILPKVVGLGDIGDLIAGIFG
jgi:hypothetical protein